MRITKWGAYGILCCLYLAQRHAAGGAVGASEIAKAQELPIQYAHQILQRLRKGGIIKSMRGPRGGYQLSCDPDAISLRSVLQATEGATFEIMCERNPLYQYCSQQSTRCNLAAVWHSLQKTIDDALESYTLGSILKAQPETPLLALTGGR